ncbi:response regulator [Mucilaginibacter conchicola]|uniref:Response regulator n=1 Tax=Mucilaginibacter conchicola TaxID=2303333 RepID=A0A372NRT2_9SPHI|nr:response regulator [Mucilaginibacter conchicola]RFZ91307.1 response regulator [Mucilaginibacter conchicola]
MKKILLLDDNPDVIQIVEEVLAYDHYEVQSTQTCVDFLETIQSCKPDVIMLDYALSDGNGGELCKAIKAHPRTSDIPVIIFSAYSRPGLDFIKEFGSDAFLAKPFGIDDLLKTVTEVMQKKSLLPVETLPPLRTLSGKN